MQCYNCKRELATNESINIEHYKDGEVQVITRLHPECYNSVVRYLEQKNAEWQANQVPAHRSSRLSGQAPQTRA